MKWVTRRHIRVNRTATAWLIRKFIDPQAEFFFVADDAVAQVQETQGATGFDAPGARYPHKDAKGRCSFEALVDEHCAADPVLKDLALIVHSADFADQVKLTPEGAGLRAISQGFPLAASHDHEILDRASFLYDALYGVLKVRRERGIAPEASGEWSPVRAESEPADGGSGPTKKGAPRVR